MSFRLNRTLLMGVAGTLLFGAGAAPAGAQEAGAREADTVDTIIVTARRRAENLQDTPVSVTAFTGDALDDRLVFSTDALDQITPNLQFANNAPLAGNNSSSQVFIRGVGQTDPTSTVDPGVAIYIDDVYQSGGVGGTMDFRDIASVQVLRGPQGTLFGRNTVGGAVVLTSTDPGDDVGGTLRVRGGVDNLVDVFGALDLPLGDAVRTRFTVGRRLQDGYVVRPDGMDLGDTDTYTVTGKFIVEPTNQFSARFQFNHTFSDENGSPLVFAAMNEAATFARVASFDAGCPGLGAFPGGGPVPLIDDPRCGNDFQNAGPFANNGTYPLESKLALWGGALVLEYDTMGPWSFKSVTSYRDLDWKGIRDADNTPLTILHTLYVADSADWSQEFQLSFESDNLHGVTGAYYFDGESDDFVYVQLNTPAPGVQEDSDNNVATNTNWAVFTEWTWDVTDALSLTVGGRYTEDTKGSLPRQFNYADLAATDDTPGVITSDPVEAIATDGTTVIVENGEYYLPPFQYEATETSFTPSATIAYRWSEAVMTYLRYAEGFKGGGWNSHFNRRQTADEILAFQQFGPEFAETIELGAKLDMLDRRLRINAAAFTTDYTDLQFTYRVGVAPYLANAGEASIDGFEVEWYWALGGGLYFDGGVGHLDTSIDRLEAIAGTAIGVVVGNKLPFAPEWQGNLGVGYDGALGGGWTFEPRVDMFYQDQTFFDANNTVEIAQTDSVTLWNASFTVGSPDGGWSFLGGVNNISDEVYPIAGNSSLTTGSGYAEIAYNRGQTWFLGIQRDF